MGPNLEERGKIMLYEVKAIRNRHIKTTRGYVKSEDGIVAHRSFQRANSVAHAVKLVKDYYMPRNVRYDYIECHAA